MLREQETDDSDPEEEHEPREAEAEEEVDHSVGLSFRQNQAIMLLTCGTSILETAELVGVDPSTIHRWRRYNFKFQAALNASKKRVLDTAQSVLVASSLKAAENVSDAILQGDEKISLRVLERLGALSPPTVEPEDHITIGVDTVQQEWIKTIGEGGLSALEQLLRTLEDRQGKSRKAVEKLLESGFEPGEEDDDGVN